MGMRGYLEIAAAAGGSGSVVSGEIASGSITGIELSSGCVQSGHIGNAAVNSGNIGSGQIGSEHIADGTVIQVDIGSGAVGSGALASGAVSQFKLGSGSVWSGHVTSGGIWGLVGSLPHIASGSMTGFELGSGAVVSGRVASGQLADFHFASGAKIDASEWGVDTSFFAGERISGGGTPCAVSLAFLSGGRSLQTAMASISGRMPAVGIVLANYNSGDAVAFYRGGRVYSSLFNFSGWANRPVYVGRSGQISASGAPTSSGDVQQIVGVVSQNSGLYVQVGDALEEVIAASGDIGSGSVTGQATGTYFTVASGSIARNDLNSGCVVDYIACEEAISGVRAVAWGSGGCFLVNAQRTSGLRSPAIGVAVGNYVSGDVVTVVRRGLVRHASSGTIASGFFGRYLYCGSGGLIINQSGFMGGTSSGEGAAPTAAGSGYSGALVQRVGVSVSGGIDVNVEELTSGLISGHLGQY